MRLKKKAALRTRKLALGVGIELVTTCAKHRGGAHHNRELVQDNPDAPDQIFDPLSGGGTDGEDVLQGDPLSQQELAHLVDVVSRVGQVYFVVRHHLRAHRASFMLTRAVF